MAINIDTAYKTVLLILNKEERGYVTPDEFNKIANQVQLEIFEQYSDDLNQQLRVPQSDTDYANRIENIDEKLSILKSFSTTNYNANDPNDIHFELKNNVSVSLPIYRLGTVTYKEEVELQRLQRMEFYNIQRSPLTKSTESFPTYLLENNKLYVKPNSITTSIGVSYLRIPTQPRWGYSIGTVGQLQYDASVYSPTSLNVGNGTLTDGIGYVVTEDGWPDGTYTGDVDKVLNPTNPWTSNSAQGSGLEMSLTILGGIPISASVIKAGENYLSGDVITIDSTAFQTSININLNVTVTLQDVMFNANSTYGSTAMELDVTEQTSFVIKTLFYFGVVVKDPQIIQVAARQILQEENNKKS